MPPPAPAPACLHLHWRAKSNKAKSLVVGHAVPLALILMLSATGPSLDSSLTPLSTALLLPCLLFYFHLHLSASRILLAWTTLALGHYLGYAGAFHTPNDQGDLVNSLHPAARLLLGFFSALPYTLALLSTTFLPIRCRRHCWLLTTNHRLARLVSSLAHRSSWLAFPATLTAASFLVTRLSPFGTWANFSDGVPTGLVSVAVLNLMGLHGLVFLCALFATLIILSLPPHLGTLASAPLLQECDEADGTHSASPYTLAAAADASMATSSSPPMSDLDLHGLPDTHAPPPPPRMLARRVSSSMFAESGLPSLPATPVRPAANAARSTQATAGDSATASHGLLAAKGVPAHYFLPAMRRLFGGHGRGSAGTQAPSDTPTEAAALPALDPPPATAIPPHHTRTRTADTSATSLTAAHGHPPPPPPPPPSAAPLPLVLARALITLALLATYTSLVLRPAALTHARSPVDPATDRLLHVGCVVNHQAPARDVWKTTQVLANAAASSRNATGAAGPRIIMWSEEATRMGSEYERAALVEHAQKVARAHGVWLGMAYWEPAGLPPLIPADGDEADAPVPPGGSRWVGKNKLTLVSPRGEIKLDYVKAHPVFDVETDIRPGTARAPPVVDVDGVKVAVAICLDGDFDGWVQRVAGEAEVLIMPSWTWGSLGPTHRLHAQQRASATGLTVVRCPSWGTMSVDLPTGDAVYAQRMGGVGATPMVPVPVVKLWTLQALAPDWIVWVCVVWWVVQVVAGIVRPTAEGGRRGGHTVDEDVGEHEPLLRHVVVHQADGALVCTNEDVVGGGRQLGQPLPYPSDFFASWGDDPVGGDGDYSVSQQRQDPQTQATVSRIR